MPVSSSTADPDLSSASVPEPFCSVPAKVVLALVWFTLSVLLLDAKLFVIVPAKPLRLRTFGL